MGYDEVDPGARSEVPGSELHLILSLGPRLKITTHGESIERRSFIVGPHDASSLTEPLDGSAGIQVRIDPIAAQRFFGASMHELFNRCEALDDVLGNAARDVERRVASAPDWPTRFAVLDTYLGERLEAAPAGNAEVEWAVRTLQASEGRVEIGLLSSELGWSRKRMAATFREYVGMTPKRFARLLRFERAMELLRAGGRPIDVAIDCGYSDQAHLCREVKAFAGTTIGNSM